VLICASAIRSFRLRVENLRYQSVEILIDQRFNGPPGSANGGYTCGLVAGLVPSPPSFEEAEAARPRFAGFREHAYPTCFVCGPAREDGLSIFASPLNGVVAAAWVPDEAGAPLVWASLDCPGAYALEAAGRSGMLLGRLHGRVDRVPAAGERCVVVGWPLGWDGRKGYAGTALWSADRCDLLACARATWIVPSA
jgi:hypothetical protein